MLSLRLLFSLVVVAIVVWTVWTDRAGASAGATARARKFIEAHTAKMRPLEIAANRAWWDANISGEREDFKRKEEAQNKLDAVLADRAAFQEAKAIKEADGIEDPVTKRAIDIIYLAYLEKQVDPELLKKINALANRVEEKF